MGLGGGGSKQPSTPAPPPTPVIKYDPATTAAEAALADAAKQSYATSVETEDEKAKKSQLGKAPAQQAMTRSVAQPVGNTIGSSAVVTG